ncbi:glycosyltransferase family 2 protein [Thiobacillus sedimenti]|uniref:Glycosyltransferase family 2 protein n=1 Tax=Thiobacillus sedimenti TaxID=3110231 RepID=A0ABZ1CGA3_9PROT|nr:glycosyltransferase family 2 protein [Thiobacillus sp. SCUT-2]WRS38402.1 glycosyltransferase family 2 protein [Thiobacillus sp. SCUT-2]
MKLSIITVCFNSEQTIERTLQSVVRQRGAAVEHIVVDGASTDGTMDILEAYRRHLAQVISEPDHGIYDAMNKGVRAASGDVIGFLNSDDVYADADVLAKVGETMERHHLEALFGDVAFYRPERPERMVRRYSSARFRPDRIAWGWMPAHPALFVRREVFQNVGPFKPDYRIAGDFEFVARVFRRPDLRYRYLPEVLVKMRVGGVSTGGWRNTMLLNREVLRACKENGIPTNMLKILSKYPAKFLEYFRK